MKYLVMECHPGYAVVLDEEGRFLKTANLGYEVGQRIDLVLEPSSFELRRRFKLNPFRILAFIFILCIGIGAYLAIQRPIGSVRLKMQSDIILEVNRLGRVIDSDDLNRDGDKLLDECEVEGQQLKDVLYRLSVTAIRLGFLESGDELRLTVKSDNSNWRNETEAELISELSIHLSPNRIDIVVGDPDKEFPDDD